MKEKQQLIAIRNGDQAVLRKIYSLHRSPFLEWSKKRFQVREEDLLDIFQESVIVFYQNIQEGKIQELNCSIRTYLFSVGKNLIFKQFQKQQKTILKETIDESLLNDVNTEVYDQMELNHHQRLLKEAFAQLGTICRQLLTLFYYREFALESIATQMGYKNTDTVKSQKRRCMHQLETLLDTKEITN